MTQHFESKDLANFGNLLSLIKSNEDSNYDSVRRFLPNDKDFKIVEIINKHYGIAYDINNTGNYFLTTIGLEINDFGIKPYIQKLYVEKKLEEQDKLLDRKLKELNIRNLKWTPTRSWLAIGISLIAVLIATLTYSDKHNDNQIKNRNNETNPTLKCCDSLKVNQIPKIDTTTISKDTPSTIIIPDSSKIIK